MSNLGRPAWVYRVQRQGLTPAVLEQYLEAGWPIGSIAEDRHLNVEDVTAALQRWGLGQEESALAED